MIVDIFIPCENLITEIKSSFTLNMQNMKDKVKAYKEKGYNFKLMLDKQDQTILFD
jgi:hypothetical protein